VGHRKKNYFIFRANLSKVLVLLTMVIFFSTNSVFATSLSLSNNGLNFIKKHEGLKTHLYLDQAGNCTIGYGHLVHKGACNGSEQQEFQSGITQNRALDLLRSDVNWAVNAVNNNVQADLTQTQFDALVDFVFNEGTGSFKSSQLLTELNQGNYGDVCHQLSRWVLANHKVLPVLEDRRIDECKMFTSGISSSLHSSLPMNQKDNPLDMLKSQFKNTSPKDSVSGQDSVDNTAGSSPSEGCGINRSCNSDSSSSTSTSDSSNNPDFSPSEGCGINRSCNSDSSSSSSTSTSDSSNNPDSSPSPEISPTIPDSSPDFSPSEGCGINRSCNSDDSSSISSSSTSTSDSSNNPDSSPSPEISPTIPDSSPSPEISPTIPDFSPSE
jgi:lysozyme